MRKILLLVLTLLLSVGAFAQLPSGSSFDRRYMTSDSSGVRKAILLYNETGSSAFLRWEDAIENDTARIGLNSAPGGLFLGPYFFLPDYGPTVVGAQVGTFWRNGDALMQQTTSGPVDITAGGGGGGITSLGGQTGATQTLSTGTTGVDIGWASSANDHKLNVPDASGTSRGLITPTDWTEFNTKLGTLNGLVGSTQTFATSTTGFPDVTWSSSGTIHTLVIPDASGTSRGALTSTDWTEFNTKLAPDGDGSSLTSIPQFSTNNVFTGTNEFRNSTFRLGQSATTGGVLGLYSSFNASITTLRSQSQAVDVDYYLPTTTEILPLLASRSYANSHVLGRLMDDTSAAGPGKIVMIGNNGGIVWRDTAGLGGGGTGTPGGSNTQVQFNDGGAFGGDAGLAYNKTTDAVRTVDIFLDSLRFSGDSAYITNEAIDESTDHIHIGSPKPNTTVSIHALTNMDAANVGGGTVFTYIASGTTTLTSGLDSVIVNIAGVVATDIAFAGWYGGTGNKYGSLVAYCITDNLIIRSTADELENNSAYYRVERTQ